MKDKKNKFKSDFENNDSNLQDLNDTNSYFDNSDELTREERKIIRETKRKGIDRSKLDPYDQSDIAEAKRYAKKNKFKVAFVALTIGLLLAIIATIAVVLVVRFQSGPSRANYQVTIEEDKPYELSYKQANKYGEFYFDLCVIANRYSDIIISGDTEKGLSFLCSDGTYVRFVNDSATATVNGVAVKVGGKVKITPRTDKADMQCQVPFKFIEKLFSHKAYKLGDKSYVGLVVKVNDDNEVTIRRKVDSRNKENVPISFSADCFTASSDVQLSSYPNSDIDSKTATALCVEKLILVNQTHLLSSEEISTSGLVSLKEVNPDMFNYLETYDNKDFFDPIAALALVAMINEANKNLEGDEKILVSSAYRSYDYQEGLFEKYVSEYISENPEASEEEAKAFVALTSAPAGGSEHHTGLCVDLVRKGSPYLSENFEDTDAFDWLSQNAHKYGFILRYPKDKIDITKYSYEPWHYRFVGVYAANIIHEDGITLEEYLAEVK